MSQIRLTTVDEMIEAAFNAQGHDNMVNIKLVKTILLLLASTSNMSERKVSALERGYPLSTSSSISYIVVKKVKLKTHCAKKKRAEHKYLCCPAATGGKLRSSDDKDKKKGINAGGHSKDILKKRTSEKLPPIEDNLKSKTRKQSLAGYHGRSSGESPSKAESDSSRSLRQNLESIEEEELSEQLIIVKEVSKKDTTPDVPLSIVTSEQFEDLVQKVIELQKKFGYENEDLITLSYFSDPIAAVQISRRIQLVEDYVGIMPTLRNIARTTGLKIMDATSRISTEHDQNVGLNKYSTSHSVTKEEMSQMVKEPVKALSKPRLSSLKIMDATSRTSLPDDLHEEKKHDQSAGLNKYTASHKITKEEMLAFLKREENELKSVIRQKMKLIAGIMEDVCKNAADLGRKFGPPNVIKHFLVVSKMEERLKEGVSKINNFLNVTLIHAQEFISKMNSDLEDGLLNFELNQVQLTDPELFYQTLTTFRLFSSDMKQTEDIQMALATHQCRYRKDLKNIRKMLQELQEHLANRDDVIEALSGKVGVDQFHSFVNKMCFNAVRGDVERRIYGVFIFVNQMKVKWASYLKDLEDNLSSKCEKKYVESLHDDINAHILKLRKKLDDMLEVCRELPKDPLKIVIRSDNCLSCNNKPKKSKVGTGLPTIISSPIGGDVAPTIMQDEPEIMGAQKNRNICIPEQKIPHPLDSRAETCSKYCGSKRREKHVKFGGYPSLQSDKISLGPRKVQAKRTLKFPCLPCNKKAKDLTPKSTGSPCQCGDKLGPESRCNCHLTESELRGIYRNL